MTVVVNESGQKEFEKKVNALMKDGYKLSSSSCGFVGEVGNTVYDCEYFMAIMVKDGGRKVGNA